MKNQFLFPRLYQIYEKSDKFHPGNCLSRLFNKDSEGDFFYRYWETLFKKIDEEENWEIFKSKVAENLHGIRKKGKVKIIGEPEKKAVEWVTPPFKFIDVANEIHGYLFLKDEIGCEKVNFLESSKGKGKKTPDMIGRKEETEFVLEVKTINTSDDQLARWLEGMQPIKGYNYDYSKSSSEKLIDLKCKFCQAMENAREQLDVFPQESQKIVFFVIDPDELDFYEKLPKEIQQDLTLVNKDISICGIFQSLFRLPKYQVIHFLDCLNYEKYLLKLIDTLHST